MVRWQISAILGVAAAVAVTAASLITKTTDIAVDLGTRAGQVLAGEATSWASVDVHGRDLRLKGDAPSEDLRQLAIERLKRLYGVRSVDASAAGLLPEISPYVTSFERSGGIVTLTGAVPSLPDRARILGALATASPGLSVADHSVLARGAGDLSYVEALRPLYALPKLLSHGKVTLSDHQLSIIGEAVSNAAYDALTTGKPTLSAGYTLGAVEVSRPLAAPFVISIDRDDAGITLSGFVPEPSARSTVLDAVRQAVGPRNVFDNLDYASGAPERFVDTIKAATDYLNLLSSAHISISDRTLVISGRAASPDAFRTLNAYLETWNPAGFDLQRSIALPIVEPFTLSASKSGGRVTVSGFVRDATDRATLRDAAKAIAGDTDPVIETTLADGAPSGFGPAATFAIGLLGKTNEGAALVSDTHISLSGVAASAGDLIELQADLANPPDGFDVTSSVTPPVVVPYVWSISKDADQLTVSGSVPSEAVRTAIGAIVDVGSPNLGLVDRTGLGAGLDPAIDLVAVARKATALLSHLDEGEVRFIEGVLSVTGKASAADASAAIDRELADLPAGVVKGGVTVTSGSAFRFFIERGLDTITLDGQLADDATRKFLREAAEAAFGAADILDSTEIAKAVPPSAREATLFAVRAASLLAKGNVSIEGNVIAVHGSAFTGVGATRLPSELSAAVPPGYKLEVSVDAMPAEAPLEPAACADGVRELLGRAPVHFEAGSAAIATSSRGIVDRLGALVLRCPAARLAITATASATDAAAAEALAKSRAGNVAAMLVDVGVDPARLTTSGASGTIDGLSIVSAPTP